MQFLEFFTLCAVSLSLAIGSPLYADEAVQEEIVHLEEALKNIMHHMHVEPQPARSDQHTTKKITNQLEEAFMDHVQPVPLDDTASQPQNDKPCVEEKLDTEKYEKLLLYTNDTHMAINELTAMGGKVTMRLGSNLLIAFIPINKKNTLKTASTYVPTSTSKETLQYVKAYWNSVEADAMEQPEVHYWTDKTPPMAYENVELQQNNPYARPTMTGSIAVGVVAISGLGELGINEYEYSKIQSQVVSGLDFLSRTAPGHAQLQFWPCFYFAPISLGDSQFCSDNYPCHDRLVSAALPAINFQDKNHLAGYIKTITGAQGVYLAFFTKYNLHHFAYAYFKGGPVYMQYGNDGWGPNQIDRVFAHETGHVFNAPDEYNYCNCGQSYGLGECNAKNGNCVDCVQSQQTRCIMNRNEFAICQYTRKHIGWCN